MRDRVILLAAYLLAGHAWTADAGNFEAPRDASAFKILKLTLDPRLAAMGGAGTALPATAFGSQGLNPAAAALDTGVFQAYYGRPHAASQSSIQGLAVNVPGSRVHLALDSRFLGFDPVEGWDEYDRSTGNYSAHSFAAGASISGHQQQLAWGAGLGYAQQNISWATYHTMLLDAGVQYSPGWGVRAGASLQDFNLWSSSGLTDMGYDPFPPTTLRIGLGYETELPRNLALAVTADARSRNDEKIGFPIGTELSWMHLLHLRAGMPAGHTNAALSFGGGIHWSFLQIDYAIERFEFLPAAHHLLLGVRF